MTRLVDRILCTAALIGLASAAGAQTNSMPAGPAPLPRSGYVDVPIMMAGVPPLKPLSLHAARGPRQFVSDHKGKFNGQTMRYRAELSEVVISDSSGGEIGNLFTTSYVAASPKGSGRPVLFAFNGGPGGASALLHLASLGPKRLTDLRTAALGRTDNTLIDNPASILDVADLVIIDPIDTGFGHSRPGGGSAIRTLDADSDAFTQVILNWLRSHDRMQSRKYILGESYGTLREIALARDLARSEDKVVVDGLVMAGTAFMFGSFGRVPSPVMVAEQLPMMASVAWHYGKIDNKGQSWDEAVEKARRFARDHYVGALMLGNQLDPGSREKIVAALPDLIGIPSSYFRSHNSIAVNNFNAELLRDQGLVIDRNNGLDTAPVPTPGSQAAPPSFDRMYAGVVAAMEGYAASDLKAHGLGSYTILDPEALKPGYWDMTVTGDTALDATLAKLLNTHRSMQLLVLQGRYDTLTDLGSTEYMLGQLNVAPSRYQIAYYDGGHMLMPEAEAIGPLRDLLRGGEQGRR